MNKDNREYYERRAREEAAAAASAASVEAASAHRLLAIEYQAQARELGSSLELGVEDRPTADTSHAPGAMPQRTRPKLRIKSG